MRMRVTPVILIATVCVFGIYYSMQNRKHTSTVFDAFDTVSTITVYSSSDNTKQYEELIKKYDKTLSSFNPDSEIYKLNTEKKADISDDTEELLCNAITYSSRLSDYFDISINPLCEIWNKAKEKGVAPVVTKENLSATGIEKLNIDIDNNTATLTHPDASITLGAVAKGYVTDKLVHHMKLNGDTNALINLGGNIYALGTKPFNKKWNVGIADPKNPSGTALVLEVKDLAVVTSGDYERFFEVNSKRYHHILNPKTGMPTESGLRSATAIGKKAELCDILSTTMFSSGKEKALELAKEYAIDAVLIDDSTITCTSGIYDMVKSNSSDYTLSFR